MRLSGLASGIDTDMMVQNLMRIERMKVDRFTQTKQINLWKQQEYNKMNNNIANFILNSKKNMGLNKVSSTGAVTTGSYKNLDYVSKATSSNEGAVEASVIGKASNGSFEVEVESVGKAASYTTGKISNKDLKGLESYTLEISGEEVVVKGKAGKDVTVNDIVDAINSHSETTEDGKSVSSGLSAFYDNGTGRIFIQKEATDKDVESIKNGEKNNFEIDIQFTNIGKINDDTKSIEGNITKAKINGVSVYSKDNNIKFNGLNINVKKAGEVSTITVSTNTEGIMDKIKGLVDEYNELLDTISQATGEKRYKNYHPLSQEEKKEMTDDDIKLWEEKAKSGMLNNDETLNRTLQNIRTNMFKNVEGLDGKFKNITEIGITTEKYSKGSTGGKLQIDESKLRRAIEEDAEGVMELLFSEEKKDVELDNNTNIGSTNKGVFTGIYDGLIDGMKSIIDKSGPGEDSDLLRDVKSNILIDFVTKKGSISELDKNIGDIDKRIADLERMLARKEESYYQQFTAMEKYMYEMNSQSQWIGQQMMM